MQIRLGTAKAMGYSGGADGLLDADTNMTYAVKYLAGAYRAAGGNEARAVSYYQRGYYQQAKAKGFSPDEVASYTSAPAAAVTLDAVPEGIAIANITAREAASAGAILEGPPVTASEHRAARRTQQQAKRDTPTAAGGPLSLLADAMTPDKAKPQRARKQRTEAQAMPQQFQPLY
jgi:hypothetical protein